MSQSNISNRTVAIILFGGFGIFAVVAFVTFFYLTEIAGIITQKIPYKYDVAIGEAATKHLALARCDAPEAQKSLQKLSRVLLKGRWDLQERPFHFHLIDSPMVNAGALPGGHILIFRGIFEKAEDQNEFAGVLAHEFQHVMLRHSMSALVETALLSGVWSLVLGDASEIAAVSTSQANELLGLRFSRLAEADADKGALELLDRAKVSRNGFVRFWKKSSSEEKTIAPILSTHPPSDERYALAKLNNPKHRNQRILTKKEWLAIKNFCKEE